MSFLRFMSCGRSTKNLPGLSLVAHSYGISPALFQREDAPHSPSFFARFNAYRYRGPLLPCFCFPLHKLNLILLETPPLFPLTSLSTAVPSSGLHATIIRVWVMPIRNLFYFTILLFYISIFSQHSKMVKILSNNEKQWGIFPPPQFY